MADQSKFLKEATACHFTMLQLHSVFSTVVFIDLREKIQTVRLTRQNSAGHEKLGAVFCF